MTGLHLTHSFPNSPPEKLISLWQRLCQQISQELLLNWYFIRRDILVSIIPGILFATTALINHPVEHPTQLIRIGLKELIYPWLCITTFCISSQLVGIEEDRINKPDRPLIQGLVSISGARQRWIIGMFALSIMGYFTHTLMWVMTWQLCCLIYDYAGGARHWYLKTLLGGVGLTSLLAAAWQFVAPNFAPIVWRWLIVIFAYLSTLIAVQDFRDIEGDQAIGRKTMPIIFGQTLSRYIIAAGYFGFPLIVHQFLMVPAELNSAVIPWDIFLAGFSVTIGLRTLTYRNPQADKKTYIGFAVLLCAYLVSSIFVLRV